MTEIDAAMQAIEDEQPRRSSDLQLLRLVKLRDRQDHIDVDEMIERHGWDTVEQTARILKHKDGFAPWPSYISAKLDHRPFNREQAIKQIRMHVRDRYTVDRYVSNALLDELIAEHGGWQKQFRECHKRHGYVSREWIESSLEDRSIVALEAPRSDDDLRKVVAKIQSDTRPT